MKKLSEIGKEHESAYRVMVHGEGIIEDDTIISIVLTPAERRELVKAAINGWESFKWHRGFADGKLPTFEEFCEEQGL
jgi:hypothetical protein